MEGPHPVRREQVEDLADLLTQVFGFKEHYHRERMLSYLASARTRRGSLIISEQGRPVSHIRTVYDEVSIYGCRFRVASIGGVATHPNSRGRGYATTILQESLEQMVRAGAAVLIVSGDRGLYRRAHCVPAGRVYQGEVRLEDLPVEQGRIAARRVTPDQWPLLAPLHQAEPVRFLRDADFLRHRCFWWDCNHPEVWLIECGAEPIAYLMLSRDGMYEPKTRRLILSEYAGSRAALLEALPAIFAASELEVIRVNVLGHDREFLHLLGPLRVGMKASPLPGTHRLLDLPGLIRRLRPYLAARLPRRELRQLSFHQEADTCIFACGGETVQVSLSQAAALVLGGRGSPRLPGDLARALSAIFPLPFPMPGFNYV